LAIQALTLNNYPISKVYVQEKDTTNTNEFEQISSVPTTGRIVALDPGTKRIGVAVCDELQQTTRPLSIIKRMSWKKLLLNIKEILGEFDAQAVVIGLPYNFDGTESEMSNEARKLARNLSRSIEVPVFLQDERATTYEARSRLWALGMQNKDLRRYVDSEAAAIILSDFLDRAHQSFRHEND
jgi:putative Holliday junction resolvase